MGEFERGCVNLPRTARALSYQMSPGLVAESRENVSNAVAGDIIGVYDRTYQVVTKDSSSSNLNHRQPTLK